MFNIITNIISIFFALLGYSFQVTKSLFINNNRTNLYIPFLHFFQKKNVLFPFFRYNFSIVKILIFFIIKQIKKHLNFIVLFNIIISRIILFFYFNVLILKYFERFLYFKNYTLFTIYKIIKLKLINIKQTILKRLYKYKDNTKIISWYHDIFATRRKWIEKDGALFFISHFIIYNLTLAYLIDLSITLIYIIVKIILLRKIILVSKQFKAFLFFITEMLKIIIYIVACFSVIQGKYPNKIPLFSEAVNITIGTPPGTKKTKLKMPNGYTLNNKEILDPTI